MARISAEEVRRTTLRRQFPVWTGRGPDAVLALFARLGPVQSQVPRAPFLAVSSRLPGTAYAVVRDLLAGHQLLKTTTIRGTVHTSDRADFVRLDAVCRQAREAVLRRELRLDGLDPSAVGAEAERFAADWVRRDALVAHLRGWLSVHGRTPAPSTLGDSLLWGHSGLIRRPKDERWEKRTDTFHRAARRATALDPAPDPDAALAELVRRHLLSYGPLTRSDLAFFFGAGLGRIDTAVAALGEEVVRLTGPQGELMLDTAEPCDDGTDEPGVRLLPEFDGLLVGYAGPGRTRFVAADHLPRMWAKANGLFSPIVLADGRLVATWKTIASGRRARVEVDMLPGERRLSEDELAAPLAASAAVLDLQLAELRIR